jgi:mono/diheme cytochrome c family protein
MYRKGIWLTFVFLILSLLVATGCTTAPAPAPTPTPAPAPTPAPIVPGTSTIPPATQVMEGKGLYDANCAGCHGAAGVGGSAPALNTPEWSDPSKVITITKKGKKGMPAYEGKLKDDEITAIGKYVASLKK